MGEKQHSVENVNYRYEDITGQISSTIRLRLYLSESPSLPRYITTRIILVI